MSSTRRPRTPNRTPRYNNCPRSEIDTAFALGFIGSGTAYPRSTVEGFIGSLTAINSVVSHDPMPFDAITLPHRGKRQG